MTAVVADQLEALPDRLLAVDDAKVRYVIALVERSGVLAAHAEWVAEERKSSAGRKAQLGTRALVVAMVLSVYLHKPQHIKSFIDVLYRQISPTMRAELGVPDPPPSDDRRSWENLYRTGARTFERFLKPMDPSWLPKGRCLPDATFKALSEQRRAARTEEQWQICFDRLEFFCNELIEMTLPDIPEVIRWRITDVVGVDATFVPSRALGVRHEEDEDGSFSDDVFRHSADPDAAWYHRDRSGVQGKAEWEWGYEVTLLVAAPKKPRPEEICPSFIFGMSVLHRPGVNPGWQGVRAIQNLRARGHEPRFAPADGAYTQALPENWSLPLRAMGVEPVHDYKKDEHLGPQPGPEGSVFIEGSYYCPMVPESLARATVDFKAGRMDESTWRERLAERENYRLTPKDHSDKDGFERLGCPASGQYPKVACHMAGRTRSVALRRGRGGPVIVPDQTLQEFPPKVCRQQTISVPPSDHARLRQTLPYQSQAWLDMWPPTRSRTEGINGMLKDDSHEDMGSAGNRRVHGIAAQSVFVALLGASLNLRIAAGARAKLDAFRPTRRRRRTSPSISEWLPVPSTVVAPRAQAPPGGVA